MGSRARATRDPPEFKSILSNDSALDLESTVTHRVLGILSRPDHLDRRTRKAADRNNANVVDSAVAIS